MKKIIDTTLRDGAQTPGLCLPRKTRLYIARLLDQAGVHQIEAGTPAMGSYEKDTILKIMENRVQSRIAVWNRLNRKDILASFSCAPDVIHISAPVSARHIFHKLRKDQAWLQNTLKECVCLAKERGYAVMVGFEDASRASLPFMLSLLDILAALDVELVRFADTVGVLTPSATETAIRAFCRRSKIAVGIHAHNDFGMAVANSLSAANAGASYVDATLFGLGERAGNCDLGAFTRLASRAWHIRPSPESVRLIEEETAPLIFQKIRELG